MGEYYSMKPESAKKKSTGAKSASAPTSEESASPYNQADLDHDQDGVLDHRPDDPGIGDNEIDGGDAQQKKGWLF